MIRSIVIFITFAIATPAFADSWSGVPNSYSDSPSASGAYGGYHDTYQSPQNDGAYRQYEQERVNRDQYQSDY